MLISYRILRRAFQLLIFVLIVSMLFPAVCCAGGGTSIKLPQGRKRIKHGIIANINCRWVDGFGHRPVRIRLSVRKTNQDRTITVHLYPNSWSDSQEPLTIQAEIEIPQGQKEVTKTIYVPQETFWNWIRADFYENGKKLKDLSMENGANWNAAYYNSGEKPCILIVDSDAPGLDDNRDDVIKKLRAENRKSKQAQQDLPNIETIQFLSINQSNNDDASDDEYVSDAYRDVDSLAILQGSGNMELLPPTDLPDSYLGLGSVDLLIMSIAELRALKENHPLRLDAIDDYVRNGGNLVVFGEEGLQQVASAVFRQAHEWIASDPSQYYRTANRERYYESVEGDNRATQNRKLKAELNKYPNFFMAKHGCGRLVVSDAQDPFQLKSTYWRFINQTIGSDRLSWVERHGIALDSDNPDFWDFLIPGYGATPVVSFLSVITLFVICIGPVNFFLLKRMKRFYLLPITVVLAAIATTTVMMVYALLSDGVQRRARLRSFTSLEPTTDGEHIAATHCRHAYLAAVAPTNGLIFPDRTTAYPIVAQYRYNGRRRQRIQPKKSQREFHYGYIGSRSTTQFLTTDVQETDSTVVISKDASNKLQAVNGLGVEIKHAWIVDDEGTIWYGQDCESEGRLSLTTMAGKDVRTLFNKILADHRPKPPDGLDKAQTSGFGGFRGYAYSSVPAYAESALLTSEMTDSLDELLAGKGNTYVVITLDAPPFVEQGLSATQEAGFHVIRGRYSR